MLAESPHLTVEGRDFVGSLGGFGAFSTPSRQHRCLQLAVDQLCSAHSYLGSYDVLSLHLWLQAHFPFSNCIGFQERLFGSMSASCGCAGTPDIDERLSDILSELKAAIFLKIIASAG